MSRLRSLTLLFLCGVAGCARSAAPASAGGRSQKPPTGVVASPSGPWLSPLDRGHPLVGRIWDVKGARFVPMTELFDEVRRSRFVGIGEQHDNADQHRLEAVLLREVSASRRPLAVFEMIDADEQGAVDRAVAAHPGDPDAVGAAVDWPHSGWPPWALYRPVFAVAAERGLRIVGGGLDREAAHRIAHAGTAALPPELVRRFALDTPLDAPAAQALRDEMRDAHCGMLPESMLDAMALIQRARDAELAAKLTEAAVDGAVLFAGNGHVRADRGVPRAFSQDFHSPLVTVALLEVHREWQEPAAYAGAFAASALPFDYVWFTPRASDTDHCAELRSKR